MGLEEFWFVLIGVLWSGYFFLEGFDFGVGMLLPVLPRDERERSVMFESIGPVWDGNEVWLVSAGAATFAAFPSWYASMFSGFYLALLLLLVFLIVRVVSSEYCVWSKVLCGDSQPPPFAHGPPNLSDARNAIVATAASLSFESSNSDITSPPPSSGLPS